MLRSITRSTLPVVSLLFLVPATARAEEPKAAATARRLMQVIDVVVEHQIDAPTRQQMVLDAIRYVAEQKNKLPPAGLSQRVSSADPDTLGTLLAEELSAYIKDGDSRTKIADLPHEIFEFLNFNNISITSQKEHRVQEQIAGNRYVGIGVAVTMYDPTQQLQFANVVPGGAADKAGLQRHDIVAAVDGKPTQGKSLGEVIQWLRGEEGTDVTIVVRNPKEKEPREYTLTRAVVPFKTIKDPAYSNNRRVVVIGFDRFRGITGSTVHDLRKIEAELPDSVEVVTFDFRGLSGRHLHHGILLANALLDGKPIGQVETTEGVRTVTAEPGTLFGDRKLIILIDNRTQGTLLWIAAAVKEASHNNEVIGVFASDGLVFDAAPLPGTEFVVTMPTARLRRVDGKPLALDKGIPVAATPLRPRVAAGSPIPIDQSAIKPPNFNQLLSLPFDDLAEVIFRLYFKNSDQPKE